MKAIIDQIREVLSDEFEIDSEEITPEANLRDTLDLDSLDYVDLVVAIESITGVKLGEEDFKEVETFTDFYKVIETKMA
ncbi:MAG TPA: acyl carrier protein [Brumimicrobium sp.]|nr:acyl carrier protein [Brumimicrobium sp.]